MPSRFADKTPEELRRAIWLSNFEGWQDDRRLLAAKEEGIALTPEEEASLDDIDWDHSEDEAVSLLQEAVSIIREEV